MSNNDELKEQIKEIIADEIQEGINEYLENERDGEGFGKGSHLNATVLQDEVDKIIKDYKKIKKRERSNLGQIKNLGLVDKHGRPLE